MVNFLQFLFILIPIGNAQWYDWSIKFSANGKSVKCSHDPPLSVYSCFVEHNPKEHINYGVNDKQLQWIGTTSATVSAMVKVEKGVGKLYFLELSEVDTVGDVYLNGVKILSVDNMFAVQRVDVTNDVKDGENDLNIVLAAPVTEALNRAKLWAMTQPPSCPAAAQTNGQCNVNMLRKAGYSFSWDWGPSMPDSGIYAMPKLYPVAATKLVESRVQLFSKYKADSTVVRVDVLIISPSKPDSNRLGVTFNPLDERNSIITASAVSVVNALPINNSDNFKSWILQVDFRLTSGADVQWWWPNGHGKPVLYNATILWEGQNDDAPQFQYKLFGFRTVQLIQDAMEDGGASFYFKINDKPIFMSGSNWIPSSSAVSDFSGYYVDNLKSAQRAGIKMLRVWGGGIYERDEFYNTADELGIMIWQDFMFACSTYENGTNFLSSVEDEVHTQLWRIGTHPAIVVFAGNNENEAALATNWWSISEANKPYYYDQYRMLYINTIRSGVLSANMSRPFLSSSPTNGIDTERENWIATNPYDVKFGDVHYYDYHSDCLDWRTFPKTRFASEFGYQDMALKNLNMTHIFAIISYPRNVGY